MDEQNLFKEDIEKESLESIENANKKYKEKIAAINELKAKLKHVLWEIQTTSYDTSLLPYHFNANEKQRQQDIIQGSCNKKGTCLKEIEIKLWQLHKIRIPQSTIDQDVLMIWWRKRR